MIHLVGRFLSTVLLSSAVLTWTVDSSFAQVPGSDPHAGHHPDQSQSPPTPDSQPVAPPANTGGMESMGMMGRSPPKQLYPSLMELPAMSPEARQKATADAQARVNTGNAALAAAQADYHSAMLAGDFAAMSRAADRQREALAELQSGTAALRALAEGQPPRDVALAWFRGQMNLEQPSSHGELPGPPFGLSWLHVLSMAMVGIFALTMLVFSIARRRRSLALVNRLITASPPRRPASVQRALAVEPTKEAGPPRVATTVSLRTNAGLWAGDMRVARITRETPTVKTFRLSPVEAGPLPFAFAPGQFLTFSTEIGGKTVRRSYTIASPPTRTAYVEITVKHEQSGLFSHYLHDKVAVGDMLHVRGPSGAFTFDGGDADSIVLIAGGVGITPMMCVIRHLTDMSWPGEIFLVLGIRSTDEFIFREELEYLQRRWPKLHVAASVSARSEGTVWMGLEGPITKGTIIQAVPGIERRRVHLCGPPGMMEAIRGVLQELAVPDEQIKTEAFGPAAGADPAPASIPAATPPRGVATLLDKVDRAAGRQAVDDIEALGPATATITFARSAKSAPLPPSATVLEVAEAVGVPIDYSCRVGTCGFCKTKLLEGKVTMDVQEALTEEDKVNGIILACQARSIGNLMVDA